MIEGTGCEIRVVFFHPLLDYSSVIGSHFFHRNSLSPRSLVYESEFSTIEPALDMYDENKT